MEKERNFLTIIQKEFEKMVEDGIIKETQLAEGIYIPMNWIFTKGLDRDWIISRELSFLLKEKNPDYTRNMRNMRNMRLNKKEVSGFKVIKIGDTIQIEVLGRDKQSQLFITNGELPESFSGPTITAEEVIDSVTDKYEYEKMRDMAKFIIEKQFPRQIHNKDIFNQLVNNMINNKSFRDLVCPPDERDMRRVGVSYSMEEMGRNLGAYYRYLMQEKQIIGGYENEINGGIIRRNHDEQGPHKGQGNGNTNPRVSDIYGFEERGEIFRSLNPFKIINFDSIGEDGKIIPGAYTTFVFQNPNNRNGYLIINEPFEGDKETRAVFISEQEFEKIQEERDLSYDENWSDFVREYIEMTGSEFGNTNVGNTYIFRHWSLENYEMMMNGVIAGKEPDKSWKTGKKSIGRATRALYEGERLVGKKDISGVGGQVPRWQVEEARKMIGNGEKATGENSITAE